MTPFIFALIAFLGVICVGFAVALRAAQEFYDATLAALFLGGAALAVDAGFLYDRLAGL